MSVWFLAAAFVPALSFIALACGNGSRIRNGQSDRKDGGPHPLDGGEDAGIDGGPDAGDSGVDRYDGGDGGPEIFTRPGINDRFAPLSFCTGRNVFIIERDKAFGFCGERPSRFYSFSIPSDLSHVEPQVLMDLPQEIGGREVRPTKIRLARPNEVLLPMMHPMADTAASFVLIDLSAAAFIAQQVSATGLQIGRFALGDPVPISGLADLALIDGEYWGLLSNPNLDGSYRFGFGISLPETPEGLVDTGVEDPNLILSNRREELEGDGGLPGGHFSFRTTHKRPTVLADLGDGTIAVQNSGASDTPASIDVASIATHQLLPERNVSLGTRILTDLPRLAIDLGAMKVYPATARSLWEVDLREEAPRIQENEITLSTHLRGDIISVIILGGKAVVGDRGGQILLVELSRASRGVVLQRIEVGRDLSHVAVDSGGRLFVSVGKTVEGLGPHIVAIDPSLLE